MCTCGRMSNKAILIYSIFFSNSLIHELLKSGEKSKWNSNNLFFSFGFSPLKYSQDLKQVPIFK